MVAPILNDPYSLAVQRALVKRIAGLREPILEPSKATPDFLLQRVFGFEVNSGRPWLNGACLLLDEARKDASQAMPPSDEVIQVLRIWDSGAPLPQEARLIDGIYLYLKENLVATQGSRPTTRRLSETSRIVAPAPLSNVQPEERDSSHGILFDGGLSVLRRIDALEIPSKEEFEFTTRSFIASQRHPIVVAEMGIKVEGFGKFIMHNLTFRDRFGWNEAAIASKSVRDLIHPESYFVFARIALILAKGGGVFDPTKVRFQRADGDYWHCLGAGLIKRIHGTFYGFGIFSDFKMG